LSQRGLPHSEISGSQPVSGSPKLIAAVHVLLRLLLPRHPPCALRSLTVPQRHVSSTRLCQPYKPTQAFRFALSARTYELSLEIRAPCTSQLRLKDAVHSLHSRKRELE
jgi:hypothetical protein